MIDIKKGEPIRLPDGTVILPNAGTRKGEVNKVLSREQVDARIKIQNALEAPFDNGGEALRRTLNQMPGDPKRMNPVMLVLSYAMWGLDSHAIARWLSIEQEQVEHIQSTEIYSRMREQIIESLRHAETGSVHGYLAQKAVAAAQTMSEKLASNDEAVQIAAAKDILDRSGFRPTDRTEHIHKFEDELRITYVQAVDPVDVDVDF